MGIKLIINTSNSALISDTILRDFADDLALFTRIAGRQGIPALGMDEIKSVAMPYLRDYADMSLMLIASLHMALIHTQWLRISRAFSMLVAEKVLNPDVCEKQQCEAIVYDANAWFAKRRWNYLALALSAAAVLPILLWFFPHFGMYSSLSRATGGVDTTWEQLAYTGWWSNPTITGAAPLLYNAAVYIVFLYYVFLHNFIGFGAVRMLYRLAVRHVKGSSKSLFMPQPYHYDGFYGLGIVRRIMQDVWLSLLMTGLSIVVMYYYVPSQLRIAVLPFAAFHVLAVLFFIVVPLYLLHKDLTSARGIRLKVTYTKITSLSEAISHTLSTLSNAPSWTISLSMKLQLLQHYAEEYRTSVQSPTGLFSPKRAIAWIIVNLIPLLGILRIFP